MSTAIKFCGMRRTEDVAMAASLAASYVGVIFADGARQVTPDCAAEILTAAGESRRVGVFGEVSAEEILAIAKAVELDVIQIHSEHTPEFVAHLRPRFDGEIWSAVGVAGVELSAEFEGLSQFADAILLDSKTDTQFGGSGRTFDWSAVTRQIVNVGAGKTVVLAGGLTPGNVSEAMRVLHPDVVDVSSGVESAPGVKDHNLMREFAEAVRRADEA